MEETLRNITHKDLYTAVLVFISIIHLTAKLVFPIQYKNFLYRKESYSNNTLWIYGICSLSFLLVTALLVFPFLKKQLHFYFSNDYQTFLFTFSILSIFLLLKFLLKGVWHLTYTSIEQYIVLLSKMAYNCFWKFIILALFSILIFYTPLTAFINLEHIAYLLLILYAIDWIIEAVLYSGTTLYGRLYKFLYLCTLEILPSLVIVKLVFIENVI